MTPNQTINAGIGTIITNQAGSDELIAYSGAGMVIQSNNIRALHDAMEKAIACPRLVYEWKQRAIQYRPRISSKTVGQYFMDIMAYHFENNGQSKPCCPWIGKE